MKRTVLVLAASAVTLACGKTGPLQPPAPRGPYPPAAVSARQLGEHVEIALTVPKARGTDASQAVQTTEVLRVAYPRGRTAPSEPDAFRVRGEVVASIDVDYGKPGDRIVISDPSLGELADAGIGWTLRYGVRVRDKRGRPSAIVVAKDLTTVPPVPAPGGLAGQASADGVRLTWNEAPGASSPAYNVYRGPAGGALQESPLNVQPVASHEYLDTTVEAGSIYRYVVRAVAAAGPPYRESAPSNEADIDASDRFAPASPTGLVAVQEGPAVRLLWNPGTEKDLDGYRVYRSVAGGTFARIGPEIVTQPSFLDAGIPPETEVRYRVTALDRAAPPNESAPSTEVGLRVAPDPGSAADR